MRAAGSKRPFSSCRLREEGWFCSSRDWLMKGLTATYSGTLLLKIGRNIPFPPRSRNRNVADPTGRLLTGNGFVLKIAAGCEILVCRIFTPAPRTFGTATFKSSTSFLIGKLRKESISSAKLLRREGSSSDRTPLQMDDRQSDPQAYSLARVEFPFFNSFSYIDAHDTRRCEVQGALRRYQLQRK